MSSLCVFLGFPKTRISGAEGARECHSEIRVGGACGRDQFSSESGVRRPQRATMLGNHTIVEKMSIGRLLSCRPALREGPSGSLASWATARREVRGPSSTAFRASLANLRSGTTPVQLEGVQVDLLQHRPSSVEIAVGHKLATPPHLGLCGERGARSEGFEPFGPHPETLEGKPEFEAPGRRPDRLRTFPHPTVALRQIFADLAQLWAECGKGSPEADGVLPCLDRAWVEFDRAGHSVDQNCTIFDLIWAGSTRLGVTWANCG